jgi:hypothetical protein
MNAPIKTESKSGKIKRYGWVFVAVGGVLTALGFLASIVSFFIENSFFLNIILFLAGVWEVGVFLFAYGLALIQGKRWHIFGLLIFVFFGSIVAGLLSMAGRETNVGYYIWAIGGLVSLSLILILVIYWESLLDG